MGCTSEAAYYAAEHILFAPGKAVNAGGVSVSGLEMSQNSIRLNWSKEEVDERLHAIMKNIHVTCVKYGTEPRITSYNVCYTKLLRPKRINKLTNSYLCVLYII